MSFSTSNLWEATATESIAGAPLTGDVAAEVAIIGGGFTGCSAALHLAEAGFDVRVLEAVTVGYGGSGRNVGLVNAGLWLPPDDVETKLGTSAGRRLNAAFAAGPALVFSLIERFAITCDATRTGTLHCAHSRAGSVELQERFRQQRERDAPVELLDAAATARLSGARTFHGALLDHRAGTIQPQSYVRGLARAATAAGARIHERSAVARITRQESGWRLACERGFVTARSLLIAVNAYGMPGPADLRPEHTPMHYFQVATPPLPSAALTDILPQRQGAWDTAAVMSSFRLDRDGRLVLGAIGSFESLGAAAHRSWAARKLRALFPQVGTLPLEHAWFGRIAMTSDRLPRIQRIGPYAFSIFGYNGRGIAPGTVMGKAFADYVASGDESAFPLAPVDRYRSAFAGTAGLIYEMGATAFHLVNAR